MKTENEIQGDKMKVLQFDKPTCRAVGQAIEQALTEVGKDYGISLKYKGGSYQVQGFLNPDNEREVKM